MSERSTPDGHDAEGNYDWRNDPLENTPIVRGYQPADILHDLRQMSGDDEALQALTTPTADFDLTPLVGMTISHNRTGDLWLSWEETQQLAEFLRRHVGA